MVQWNKQMLPCRRWEVRSDACGKNFFTAKNRKSYKNSALSPYSTLKDAGALQWKMFCFHRYSPVILHYFLPNLDPGVDWIDIHNSSNAKSSHFHKFFNKFHLPLFLSRKTTGFMETANVKLPWSSLSKTIL